MLIHAAKNDFDQDGSKTWTQIDRLSRLPIVDGHCHIFGQSLSVGDTIHEWSDPTHVTFVKAGTNGEERKLFKPAVLLLKKSGSSGPGGLAGLVRDAQNGLDEVRNSGVVDDIKNAIQVVLTTIEQLIAEAIRIRDAIMSELRAALEAAGSAVRSASAAALEHARNALTAMRSTLESTLESAGRALSNMAEQAANTVGSSVDSIVSAVRSKIGGLIDAATAQVERFASAVGDRVAPIIDKAKSAWDTVVSYLKRCVEKCEEIAGAIKTWIDDQTESARNRINSLCDEATQMLRDAKAKIDDAMQACADAIESAKGAVRDAWSAMTDEVQSKIDAMKDEAQRLADKAEEIAESVQESARDAALAAKSTVVDAVNALSDQASTIVDTVSDAMQPVSDAFDTMSDKVKKAVSSAKSSAASVVDTLQQGVDAAKSAVDSAKNAAQEAQDAIASAMAAGGDELAQAKSAVESLGKRLLDKNQDKLFARGVVEVPEQDWPPRLVSETVGDNIVFQVQVSDGATVHSYGLGGHTANLHNVTELLGEMNNGFAKFAKYFFGDDGENARVPLEAIPKMGGRAIVPYLLDLGYTPLDVPVPFLGRIISWMAGFPAPMADPEGYYKDGKEFLWFDREGLQTTYETLAQVASQYPYEIWPMVPFDPRRPDALSHVQTCISDNGFAGVKLYARCGWMPTNNADIHGAKGSTLDRRLEELYKYLEAEDLPVVNHTSPTGFPPNAALALPASYDSGQMYFHSMMHPGRVGIGPYPLGVLDLLPDNLQELIDAIGNPDSYKLKKQADAQGSQTLDDMAQFAKDAENTGHDKFWELAGAAERARAADHLTRLRDSATASSLTDSETRSFVETYIDPARLEAIASETDTRAFFQMALSMTDDELRKTVDRLDPSKTRPTLFSKQTFNNAKSAAGVLSDPVKLLYDTLCKVLAQMACFKAAKYCHYVQHTTSPYAWEPVLESHSKLRLNFAHCAGEAACVAHFDLDKSLEELEELEAAGTAVTDEQKQKAELLKDTIKAAHENPFVASGEKFKERLFAKSAAETALTGILFKWFGTAEDAVDPAAAICDLITEVLRKLLPAVLGHVLDRFSLSSIRKGTVAQIPAVLETDAWKEWLDNWAETYPDSWYKKINELIDKYDNVYTDMAYFSGGSQEVFAELLGRVRDDASPGTISLGTPGTEDYALDPDMLEQAEGEETAMADKMIGGTDWFMTHMDNIDASTFWGRIQDVVPTIHPLWERWASQNCINWMNLKDRMEPMETYWKKMSHNDELEPPKWWAAMRAYYERTAEAS